MADARGREWVRVERRRGARYLMLPGADLRAFGRKGARPEPAQTCGQCRETAEEMLERVLFLVENYKKERCKKERCPCRRACVNFHDYADRRTCGWADWQRPGFRRESNKTAECYSPYKIKTVACDKEADGTCPFGANCAFAHVLAGEPLLPRHKTAATREQWVDAAKRAIDAHFLLRAQNALEGVSPAEGGVQESLPVQAAEPQRLEVGEYEACAIDLFPGLAASLKRECELQGTVFAVERGPGKRGAVVVRPGAASTKNSISASLLRVGKILLDPGCEYEFNKTFPHTGDPSAFRALARRLLTHGQSGFGWNSQHVRLQITPESKVHLRILKLTPAHSDVAAIVRRILNGGA
jgi:hypothetical protein